jgi:hypothetical protein
MRRLAVAFWIILLAGTAASVAFRTQPDPRLKNAFRRPPENGWTFVHLEGTPSQIGYQHGYWLSREILDIKQVVELELKHDNEKDWSFFRQSAKEMLWPHIEQEYREELQGISDGAKSRGVDLDLWDIVALNGFLEWEYYLSSYPHGRPARELAREAGASEHCSAFVATGSYTRDGKVVMAHNAWSSYLEGTRWTIIFDIIPANGHRILMDGLPGLITSGDDFGLNSAGIIVTETTISGFRGYDPEGIPEFVRARKAMQYAASIDDFVRIMKKGNNGGYANDWLIADRKTNEIASLELGLKNVILERTTNGYFAGSNFPIDPRLTREETRFDPENLSMSANARHRRWDELMAEYKGKIGIEAARQFLADHFDTFDKAERPSERTLCGHSDLSPRSQSSRMPAFGLAGAVQNKVIDSQMASRMSIMAAAGHACGMDFDASAHLSAHPEFGWQQPLLRNMPSQPWTTFRISEPAK